MGQRPGKKQKKKHPAVPWKGTAGDFLSAVAVTVTALMAFAVMAAPAVAATVVTTLVVVLAHGVGIVLEIPGCQSRCRSVGFSHHTGVEQNARLIQSRPGTAADAAADQGIDLHLGQEARQGPMAAAVGGHHYSVDDLTVLHIVNLELLRMAKVLEYLTVLVSHRNTHGYIPPEKS